MESIAANIQNNFSNSLALSSLLRIFLSVYIHYVHKQRRRITDDYLEKVPYPTTLDEAHEIYTNFAFRDYPFLCTMALEFGLFKTYGIPSIAVILSKTGELKDRVAKRYDDTDLLLREFIEHNPKTSRDSEAIKQMNFIHSHYKISNRYYLYVLSIFIVEPIVWAERFGYRCPHEKEKAAAYLSWKYIAREMGIKDVFQNYEEAHVYMKDYEKKYMKPSEYSPPIVEALMNLMFDKLPFKFTHKLLLHPFVHALCPSILRSSMGFPDVLRTFIRIVESLLYIHSFIVRHLVLPNEYLETRTGLDHDDNKRVLFPKYHPYESIYKDGYRINELGPTSLVCPMK